MDLATRIDLQENVCKILGLDPYDQMNLADVDPYLNRAINYVLGYCNITEIPTLLLETVEDIAVFKYRGKGIENIKSEGKGSLSESYMESLPLEIKKQLNIYRKVKFL